MPTHDPTFDDFREWLLAGRLHDKLITQLAKLTAVNADANKHARQVNAQARDVLGRIRAEAAGLAIDRVAGAATELEALLQETSTAVRQLELRPGSRNAAQVGRSIVNRLQDVRDTTMQLEKARAERGPRAEAHREVSLRQVAADLSTVHTKLRDLAGSNAGFEMPRRAACLPGLRESLSKLSSIGGDCSEIAGLTPDEVPACLLAISHKLSEAALPDGLGQEVESLAQELVKQSPADAKLEEAWAASEQVWNRRQSLDVDPRRGFLYRFSSGTYNNEPAVQARCIEWLNAHVPQGSADSGEDGRRVLLAAIAMFCTLFRWGWANDQRESVMNLLQAVCQHGNALHPLPNSWPAELGLNRNSVLLGDIYDLFSGLDKSRSSRPREGAYLSKKLKGREHAELLQAAREVAQAGSPAFAPSLASKLAYFAAGSLRNVDEPREHGLAKLSSALTQRIRSLANDVRPGSSQISTIEGLAAHVFINAEEGETFSSTSYGIVRRNSWLWGSRFESEVMQACSESPRSRDLALDLFCRALVGKDHGAYHTWQMLLLLRDGQDDFRKTLWNPIIGKSTDPAAFNTYFGVQEQAS